MMRVFIAILCSLLAVCSVSARDSRHEGTDGQAAIYRLLPFERAVRCTKYFEGWHSEKHYPYVGYGHKLLPGERYSARTMTKRQADALLRKDLRKFCAMFRQFGKDSLLLATLAGGRRSLRYCISRNRFQWHLSSGYSKNLNAIVSNKTITFVISNLEIK